MKNKHINLLLVAMAIVLAALFMINSWIRENSARQDIKEPKQATTQKSK
ncbi:MAG: hypothetical protein ACI97A_000313 [Planctomycetota bacterium]|jgi:hypothetical protein